MTDCARGDARRSKRRQTANARIVEPPAGVVEDRQRWRMRKCEVRRADAAMRTGHHDLPRHFGGDGTDAVDQERLHYAGAGSGVMCFS